MICSHTTRIHSLWAATALLWNTSLSYTLPYFLTHSKNICSWEWHVSIKSGPRVGHFSAIFMSGGREFERCNLQKLKCRSKDVCEVVCIPTVATKGNLPKRFKRLSLREIERNYKFWRNNSKFTSSYVSSCFWIYKYIWKSLQWFYVRVTKSKCWLKSELTMWTRAYVFRSNLNICRRNSKVHQCTTTKNYMGKFYFLKYVLVPCTGMVKFQSTVLLVAWQAQN